MRKSITLVSSIFKSNVLWMHLCNIFHYRYLIITMLPFNYQCPSHSETCQLICSAIDWFLYKGTLVAKGLSKIQNIALKYQQCSVNQNRYVYNVDIWRLFLTALLYSYMKKTVRFASKYYRIQYVWCWSKKMGQKEKWTQTWPLWYSPFLQFSNEYNLFS